MRRLFVLLPFIAFLLTSCVSEMTQAELFDMTKSGSVLILNKYYYQLRLPNNAVLYFTGLDSDGDLDNVTNDIEEIRKNSAVMSGTGFFVDEKGSIMTNRHVAQPFIEESDIKAGYRNLMHSISLYYEYLKEQVAISMMSWKMLNLHVMKNMMVTCIATTRSIMRYYLNKKN